VTTLLDEIVRWASGRPDIRAVLLTGSHARGDADASSDLDVELFTTEPDRYAGRDWMTEIRPVSVQLGFEPAADRPTRNRLTVFAGGEKVDFLVGTVELLAQLAAGLDDLHERGYRILLDRDGLAARLPPATGSPSPAALPTSGELRDVVEEFWFEAWHIPKYLARGELWVVKHRDWTMKQLLLRVLEWEAGTRGVDPWHIGTRIAEWAPVELRDRLEATFGRYDAADARRAFLATTDLFADVARTVAARCGLGYPDEMEEAIRGYAEAALDA
jgi:aminoglycoside 6-adenylyltransferase